MNTKKILISFLLIMFVLSACGVSVPGSKPPATAEVLAMTTPEATVAPGPEQSAQSGTAVPSDAQTMVDFVYTWDYVPGTVKKTPQLRSDAQSTGNGVTRSFDIGVNKGELGVITGYTVTVGGKSWNPCALIVLSPGYYKDVKITSGRWEVYQLPDSEPKDPTGWSKVLAQQAAQKEHTLYNCPSKALKDIPVLYSALNVPFSSTVPAKKTLRE